MPNTIEIKLPRPRRSQMKRWRKLVARGVPAERPSREHDGRANVRCTAVMTRRKATRGAITHKQHLHLVKARRWARVNAHKAAAAAVRGFWQ